MRVVLRSGLLALAAGYVLAQFAVLFFNHWYFAQSAGLKITLLGIVLSGVYLLPLKAVGGALPQRKKML